jgi:hypothetical protein
MLTGCCYTDIARYTVNKTLKIILNFTSVIMVRRRRRRRRMALITITLRGIKM